MIKIENVDHFYKNGNNRFQALHNINLEISDGKFIMLLGQSGSGKTTLLNILSGLLKPTKGNVFFDKINICDLKDKEISIFRSQNIGFVFQNYFLENCFSSLENVMVPLFLNRKLTNIERENKAIEMLDLVGLGKKIQNKPTELSGGECQRVSIARALANDPKIIIADEPTGNLDSVNGLNIIQILKKQVTNGKTVIMVTHNTEYACFADKVIYIKDGKILCE